MNINDDHHPAVQRLRTEAAALCTEEEITALVHQFYARVREDALLGPIFDRHVDDWDIHLAKLVDFWSSVLRRTGRFSGSPMTRHAALPDLDAGLFRHWLALFRETAAVQPNQAMALQAVAAARRIAQSLWLGYQVSHDPRTLPQELNLEGLEP
ncbi:MAG: group III truncated hemoglobin [Steroidobacteraceae bacterium]